MQRALLRTLPFLVSLGIVSLWSYAYVDPNLVLFNHPVFTSFQNSMWSWRSQPATSVWLYLSMIPILWASYAWLLSGLPKLSSRQRWIVWLGVVGVLLLGQNALSHDIFNYLFNAKMVVQYGADPHVKTALDFAFDPWVRFMHNIHTPAPYAYGWTAISLIPYLAGFGKFLLAFIAMRLWMLGGLFLSVLAVRSLSRKDPLGWWSVAFHPLILIETLLNGHNDVWMMWPVLWAFVVAQSWRQHRWGETRLWGKIALVAALLALSIAIKYVTVLLIPVFFLFLPPLHPLLEKLREIFAPWWADLSAVALLVPLVTARSQQFHPWYLIWALVFFSLCRSRWLRLVLLGLSISSLLRYIPWLESNLEYTPIVLAAQRAITATGLAAGLLVAWLKRKTS